MDEATRVIGVRPTDAGELAPGVRIGAWRVLRTLGRGGMGEVYLVERADLSFDKQAALKLVQGMMTPVARLRFDAEKQALARLEHPHIARLIDAGETERGWPFLVMEYVGGMPIDHFLADRGVNEVLATFLQICDAAAYAHRQLVLHRDIKPSNILVDDAGNAKLLDFGIAKLLQSTDGVEDSHTMERAYTPEYASPEQVFGRPIGVASDVYSLGVLLYRLLTGVPPYTFAPGDTAGLVRSLSEDTVVAPSRAMLGETMQSGGARRRRSRLLVGDLDTIARTALKKQPERRYASVDALADDIRRHLAHEPIRARPDSPGYRARKFLRRNVIAVAAVVAVSVALVGGLVASLWQARIAEQERARAEQRFEDVRALAHAMIYDLNDELVKLPGSTRARKRLVQEALAYLQELSVEKDATLPLRQELASAWLRVGDVQGYPNVSNVGDFQGALKSYAHAEAEVDSILQAMPEDRQALALQATLLEHHARLLINTTSSTHASFEFQRDIVLWKRLRDQGEPGADLHLVLAQDGIGIAQYWAGRREDALRSYAQAKKMLEAAGPGEDPLEYTQLLGRIEGQQGDALSWLGRRYEANAELRKAVDHFQSLHDKLPDDPVVVVDLASALLKLGDNLFGAPDERPRLVAYERARPIFAKAVAADPADMRAKRDLALCDSEIGDTLTDLKRYDEALTQYRIAMQAQQEIAALDSTNEESRQDLANTWYGIAGVYQLRGQRDLAVKAFQETLTQRQALLAADPAAAVLKRDVAQVQVDLAAEMADIQQACSHWIAGEAGWSQLAATVGVEPTDRDDASKAQKHALACQTGKPFPEKDANDPKS